MADFSDAKRILVRSTNWLGDVVMSLPALRAIRRAFPGAHFGVMIQSKLAALFEDTAECDEVVTFERHARASIRGRRSRGALYRRLRAGEWDLGVLFPNSFSSAWYFYRGGVKRRVGYAVNWRGWTLTDRVPRTDGPLSRHQVHWYLEIARHLGAGGDPDDCLYEPPAAAVTSASGILGELGLGDGESFVVMAPAAAYGPAKEWPAEHYARLAAILEESRGLRSVFVGAPSETAKCEEVLRTASESAAGALSAAGRTDVAQLAGLMKLSAGFVGNDSGAMHLAGAIGIPTVGIFGSTQPGVTGPLGPKAKALEPPRDGDVDLSCRPCLKRNCRYGTNACLSAILPGQVLHALDPMLAPHGKQTAAAGEDGE